MDFTSKHKFFASNLQALMLHICEDEFEVCKPLGSKRKKHKLCTIYYTIGNNIQSFALSSNIANSFSFNCPLYTAQVK